MMIATNDSFSLDELKRAATNTVAENSPGGGADSCGEPENVPLRGRGWFVPYQEAALAESEEYDRINAAQGMADGPFVEYCYMCSSWTARGNNPLRHSIQRLIEHAEDWTMQRVVTLISQYYRKWVQPRVGHHWSINSIREHITQHTLNPKIVVTENIRGLQSYIDAHVSSAEKSSPASSTTAAVAAVSAEGEVLEQPPSQQPPPRKKRRVDLKEADCYLKMVRTQAMLLTMLQRMRSEGNGGGGGSGGASGGGGGGSGGVRSM